MRPEPDRLTPTASSPLQPDAERVRALHELQLLDTPPEERFDRITRLACRLLDVPISLLALVDTDRQSFKSRVGIDIPETARATSFCTHTIEHPEGLIIDDVRIDARFAANPFVRGEPHIRFYAGMPLAAPDGSLVGALCVIDRQVRHFDDAQMATLRDLAAIAGDELRSRPAGRPAPEGWEKALVAHLPDGILMLDMHGNIVAANPAAEKMFGASGAMLAGRAISELLDEDLVGRRRAGQLREGEPYQAGARRLDGSAFPVEFSYCAMLLDGAPQVRGDRARHSHGGQEEQARSTDARRRHHFATATHELRTPMSSVLGFSELLLKRDFDPATQPRAGRDHPPRVGPAGRPGQPAARPGPDRGRRQGRCAWRRSTCALVARTLVGLEGLGQVRRVGVDIAPALPPVVGDADQLQLALVNIVGNAIKYSAPARRSGSAPPARPRRRADGRDPGRRPGHRHDTAATGAAFDAFYRVDRDPSVPGSGLGMAIFKEIVDLHYGQIALQSTPGVGTEVTILLPALASDDTAH